MISIHALREEGDWAGCPALWPSRDFYPRPPRGGRPSQFGKSTSSQSISIHALREEGDLQKHGFKRRLVISIHALREEGDVQPRCAGLVPGISIHALREEGDDNRLEYEVVGHGFLSTPSARRATLWPGARDRAGGISIHALREEGDLALPRRLVRVKWISIHALREEGDLAGAF